MIDRIETPAVAARNICTNVRRSRDATIDRRRWREPRRQVGGRRRSAMLVGLHRSDGRDDEGYERAQRSLRRRGAAVASGDRCASRPARGSSTSSTSAVVHARRGGASWSRTRRPAGAAAATVITLPLGIRASAARGVRRDAEERHESHGSALLAGADRPGAAISRASSKQAGRASRSSAASSRSSMRGRRGERVRPAAIADAAARARSELARCERRPSRAGRLAGRADRDAVDARQFPRPRVPHARSRAAGRCWPSSAAAPTAAGRSISAGRRWRRQVKFLAGRRRRRSSKTPARRRHRGCSRGDHRTSSSATAMISGGSTPTPGNRPHVGWSSLEWQPPPKLAANARNAPAQLRRRHLTHRRLDGTSATTASKYAAERSRADRATMSRRAPLHAGDDAAASASSSLTAPDQRQIAASIVAQVPPPPQYIPGAAASAADRPARPRAAAAADRIVPRLRSRRRAGPADGHHPSRLELDAQGGWRRPSRCAASPPR